MIRNHNRDAVFGAALRTAKNVNNSKSSYVAQINDALKAATEIGILAQQAEYGGNAYGSDGPMVIADPRNGRVFQPIYGSSVVGYRPIITMLSKGMSLTTNAVVSADRRYVRITPSPQFNDISKVETYNMVQNATSVSDSGNDSCGGSGGFGGGMGGGGGMY